MMMEGKQKASDEEDQSNGSSGVTNVVTQFKKGVRNTITMGKGTLYHVITGKNRIIEFRVGDNGKLILENTVKCLSFHTKKLEDARQKLIHVGREAPQRAHKHVRQAITGDANKRIRDHMNEPPQVQMLDKLSFTLGVITITFAEFLIVMQPLWFPTFYRAFMLFLFMIRFFMYKQQKYHLFMLDFCYFLNSSCMIQSAFFPNNVWFNANFALSMGPIAMAIIVWNNALVFHSLEKLTSFFLHTFPSVLCHLYRWGLIPSENVRINQTSSFFDMVGHGMGIYIAWQIFYLFFTEVILVKYLNENPKLMTSLRYLAKDKKNFMNKLVNKVCKKLQILGKDEELNSEHFKTKAIFVSTQLIYTLLLVLPSLYLYHNYYACCCYLALINIAATWNGASYYVEVFSKRYNMKFHPSAEIKEQSFHKFIVQDSDTLKDPTLTHFASKTQEEDEDLDECFEEALEELNESQAMELIGLLEIIDQEDRICEDKILECQD